MHNSEQKGLEFLLSSVNLENEFQDLKSFFKWYRDKSLSKNFVVEEIPFESLDNWYFEHGTKNLKHSSGKFFSIEGINVNTNFGSVQKWEQPIIFQPEIGILGIITKVINGNRYFLMQAKMEPGNVNMVQISPTVQATKSNYTKVHRGLLPNYLEYFLDGSKSKIITDQLQTEQGARFYRKRNRNMVVEVNEVISLNDDFVWLTLGQIKKAMLSPNLINMDSRSVLSTIPFIDEAEIYTYKNSREYLRFLDAAGKDNNPALEILESATCTDNSIFSFNQVMSWITEMKVKYELSVSKIPLCNVVDWSFSESSIQHSSKPFFSIIAVKVQAGNREVISWTQPMLKENNSGLIGYIVKKINGVLHFLVQARVEPGNFDTVDLAPTVVCSYYSRVLKKQEQPQFLEFFKDPHPDSIIYSAVQSEEGGRFFHFQNLNIIIRVNEDELKEVPDNFKWLTLAQLMKLMKFGFLNIESRSLISALSLI